MATDIKGLGSSPPADQTALRNTGTAKEGAAAGNERPAAAPVVPTTAKAAADSVNLSSQAQALKSLEEKIQKLPDINDKKIAEIRAALASGQYSIDDLVVADK